jgi:hypothetical protein
MDPILKVSLHLKDGQSVHLSSRDPDGYLSAVLAASEVKSVEVVSTKTKIEKLVHQHFSV